MPMRESPLAPFAEAALDADLPLPVDLVAYHGHPPVRRFGVYRNTIITSLIEALRSQFQAIEKLVGEDYFKALAKVFIAQHPPQSPVLAHYGDDFAAFLARFEPVAHLPFLPYVAQIERAQIVAYHSADAAPLSLDVLYDFEEAALETLQMQLHPAATLLAAPMAAFSIWQENIASEAATPQNYAQPQATLITRPKYEVNTCLASAELYACLSAVIKGQTLGEILRAEGQQGLGEALAYGALVLSSVQEDMCHEG